MGKRKTVSKAQLFELHSWVLSAFVSKVDLGHGHILISKKKSAAPVLSISVGVHGQENRAICFLTVERFLLLINK